MSSRAGVPSFIAPRRRFWPASGSTGHSSTDGILGKVEWIAPIQQILLTRVMALSGRVSPSHGLSGVPRFPPPVGGIPRSGFKSPERSARGSRSALAQPSFG